MGGGKHWDTTDKLLNKTKIWIKLSFHYIQQMRAPMSEEGALREMEDNSDLGTSIYNICHIEGYKKDYQSTLKSIWFHSFPV